MGWAYVFNAKNSKYEYVDEKNLQGFSVVQFNGENPDERSHQVYKKKTTSGKVQKVQVLAADAARDRLEKYVERKRITVPKLNSSQLNDSSDVAGNASMKAKVTDTKQERKVAAKRRQEVEKKNNESIIDNFMTDGQSSAKKKKKKPSVSPQKLVKPPSFEDKENQSDSSFEKSRSNKRTSSPVSVASNAESDEINYKEENALLRAENKELRGQLKKLKKENAALVKLQESDVKEIEADAAEIPVGATRQDRSHLGYNVWIKQISYDTALKLEDPVKFIRTVAQSVWTEDELAQATTRPTKGVDRNEFSPTKKAAVAKFFSTWLRLKYSDERRMLEEKHLNNYLNRATEGARKKLKRREQ